MNQNPNPCPRDLFYCATSNVIVGTERCRLYLLASNAEQAAKYTWPTKTRKRTRYIVSCERLYGLHYADEIEAAAHRYGFADNHPHVCEVMEAHKSLADVLIQTNDLRWALTFLPQEGARTVSIGNKGLNIEGVPLGGCALYEAHMRVQSRPLRLMLEQMPRDVVARVNILGHRNARALKISLGTETHYVFDCYYGFSAFIPTGGER